MKRRIEIIGFLLGHIVTFYECFLADSAHYAEWSVEHNACIDGMIDVLIGIRHGDRTHSSGKSATHSANGKHYCGDESYDLTHIIDRY